MLGFQCFWRIQAPPWGWVPAYAEASWLLKVFEGESDRR